MVTDRACIRESAVKAAVVAMNTFDTIYKSASNPEADVTLTKVNQARTFVVPIASRCNIFCHHVFFSQVQVKSPCLKFSIGVAERVDWLRVRVPHCPGLRPAHPGIVTLDRCTLFGIVFFIRSL